MPASSGLSAFAAAFAVSPITLNGGVASGMIGGITSLMSVVQSLAPNDGGSFPIEDSWAKFQPLPNTSLIDNQIGKYPFANLAIAANAIIRQPLTVSMLMIATARNPGDYWTRFAIMTSLQNTLQNHCAQGGTFSVATPVFFFPDVIMTGLHDVSDGDTLQPQVKWRFDFEKPLITAEDAAATQSQMLSNISSGLPSDGSLSGPGAVGSGAGAGASPTVYASDVSSPGAGVPSFAASSSVNFLTNPNPYGSL